MNALEDLYVLIAISFDTLCTTAGIDCYEKSCQEENWNIKRKDCFACGWQVAIYVLSEN